MTLSATLTLLHVTCASAYGRTTCGDCGQRKSYVGHILNEFRASLPGNCNRRTCIEANPVFHLVDTCNPLTPPRLRSCHQDSFKKRQKTHSSIHFRPPTAVSLMNSRPHNRHARPAFSPYSGDGGNVPVVPRQPAGPLPHDGFAPPYHNHSNSNFVYGGAQAEHSGSFVPG